MKQDQNCCGPKHVVTNALLSPPPGIATSISLEFLTDLCVQICDRIIAQDLTPTSKYMQAQWIMQEVVIKWEASNLSVGLAQVADLSEPWQLMVDETAVVPGNLLIELFCNPDKENREMGSVAENASFKEKRSNVFTRHVDVEVKPRSGH